MKMVASFATYILSVIAVLALVTVIVLESQPPAHLDLANDLTEPGVNGNAASEQIQ